MLDCMGLAMETKGVCWACWTYMGPATETGIGVFEPMRLRRFDVGGRYALYRPWRGIGSFIGS